MNSYLKRSFSILSLAAAALYGTASAEQLFLQETDSISPDLQQLEALINKSTLEFVQRMEGFDDRYKNITEVCEENGFSHERYHVTTEDGYILSLDRIAPHGKSAQEEYEAPVVLVMHGMEAESTQWVINSPEKAIAFALSKAGYDVWLGNNRGNQQSRGHVTLTDKEKEYWDFDFEEMGLKDQPAFINFILNKTAGKNKIGKLAAYVGHSEGTTQFFIGSSLMPEFFKEKVNLFVALAPVARLEHTTNNFFRYVASIPLLSVHLLPDLIEATGFYSIIDQNDLSKFIGSAFCEALPHFCVYFGEGFFDFNEEIDNVGRYADYVTHNPAGSGWRNAMHYAQIIASKRFQRYDFGSAAANMEKYGQDTPPEYDLSKIEVPMAIAHGDVDQLADPEDVAWLLDETKSGLKKDLILLVKQYHFGHKSFAISVDGSWFPNDIMPVIAERCGNCASH